MLLWSVFVCGVECGVVVGGGTVIVNGTSDVVDVVPGT